MTSSILGKDIDTNQLIEIPQSARRQGLYIIGANGTGKTGLIENLIMQDIKQGLGVCLLDPHGDLTQAVLSRIPQQRIHDVIFLDLAHIEYPFGLNLFACSDPSDTLAAQYTVAQVMHVFEKLFAVSRDTPLILEYLRNCTYTLIVNNNTMAEIPLLLQVDQCRKKMVANVTDPDVLLFWKRYELLKPSDQSVEAASILRRVQDFLQPLTRPIVGQAKTTIDMRSVMDERKILLVKLDARLESVTSLIGSVIIAQVLNAAYARSDTTLTKRKQFNLYADEFQRFATEDFATLLAEARKFGVATTIAHQFRDQLDTQNRSATLNVANLIVLKISGKDAHELASEFDTTPPPIEEVEEEVAGFEREVETLTPVKDIFTHLLTRGSHPNPVVNTFVTNTLRKMEEEARNDETFRTHLNHLNGLFYEAMTGTYPRLDASIMHFSSIRGREFSGYSAAFSQCPSEMTIVLNTDWSLCPNEVAIVEQCVLEDRIQRQYFWVRSAKETIEREFNRSRDRRPDGSEYTYLYDRPLLYPTPEDFQDYRLPNNYPTWLHIDMATLQWENRTLVEGQEQNWIDKKGFEQQAYEHFLYYKVRFEAFITQLHGVMHALSAEPILTGSGIYEVKQETRIQKRTLTQLTSAEMENRIANKLVTLPKFTARVKIATDTGIHEHTIRTLEPEHQRLGRNALAERIAAVQAQNRTDGYTRDRKNVELEIVQRQQGCQPGQATSLPLPQQRYTRQMQLQGNCPKCGASNPPGSAFCNQCGTKL